MSSMNICEYLLEFMKDCDKKNPEPETNLEGKCGDDEKDIMETNKDLQAIYRFAWNLFWDASKIFDPITGKNCRVIEELCMVVLSRIEALLRGCISKEDKYFKEYFERSDFLQTIFPTETKSNFIKVPFLWKDMQGFYSTDSGQKLYDIILILVLNNYGMSWDHQVKHFNLNGHEYQGGYHNLRVSRIFESLRLMSKINLKYSIVRKQLYNFLKGNCNVGATSLGFWEKEMQIEI